MEKRIIILMVAFINSLFLLSTPTWAMDDHSGHGAGNMKSSQNMEHQGHSMNQDMSLSKGMEIATRKVEAYTLRYVLLDMAERKEVMKGMENMEMHGMSKSSDITNHLVVTILDPDQKTVSGKVGFIVTDPSGKEFKTLTMGMGGGYGADVAMKSPGVYKIKTKAVIGDKTIMDDFEYSMK